MSSPATNREKGFIGVPVTKQLCRGGSQSSVSSTWDAQFIPGGEWAVDVIVRDDRALPRVVAPLHLPTPSGPAETTRKAEKGRTMGNGGARSPLAIRHSADLLYSQKNSCTNAPREWRDGRKTPSGVVGGWSEFLSGVCIGRGTAQRKRPVRSEDDDRRKSLAMTLRASSRNDGPIGRIAGGIGPCSSFRCPK